MYKDFCGFSFAYMRKKFQFCLTGLPGQETGNFSWRFSNIGIVSNVNILQNFQPRILVYDLMIIRQYPDILWHFEGCPPPSPPWPTHDGGGFYPLD